MSNPVVLVLGLDPEKHEMPPLLVHHLRKMQKDFPVAFLATEDLDGKEVLETLKQMVAKSGFQPTGKKRIITQAQG